MSTVRVSPVRPVAVAVTVVPTMLPGTPVPVTTLTPALILMPPPWTSATSDGPPLLRAY